MNYAPSSRGIFVLGTPRSGTTWVANLLSNHPDVAAVMAEVHHGVHESHFFDHTRYALAGRREARAFAEAYSCEDYFFLSGITIGEFADAAARIIGVRSAGPATHFRVLMEAIARSRGATRWLEKTPGHTIYAEELCLLFPDAMFVVVERGFWPTVQSQLRAFPRPGISERRQLAEKAFRYHSDARSMLAVRRRFPERVVTVHYEDMIGAERSELDGLERALGLRTTPLTSAYAPVSFSTGSPPRLGDRATAAAVRGITYALPFSIIRWVRVRRNRLSAADFPMHSVARIGTPSPQSASGD